MEGDTKTDFKSPTTIGIIQKFLKCTDTQFECCDIVGRTFKSIEDHACYL